MSLPERAFLAFYTVCCITFTDAIVSSLELARSRLSPLLFDRSHCAPLLLVASVFWLVLVLRKPRHHQTTMIEPLLAFVGIPFGLGTYFAGSPSSWDVQETPTEERLASGILFWLFSE